MVFGATVILLRDTREGLKFMKYHAIQHYSFWPHLSMVKNHFNKPDRAGNDASTDADGKDDLHSRWDRCFTEWIV